jgi:ubiquinone/menaquinone biosynthesis C-methylase UbiE
MSTYTSAITGGKLLLEMNRILRPNGYFILSSNNDKIEDDEGIYIHMSFNSH